MGRIRFLAPLLVLAMLPAAGRAEPPYPVGIAPAPQIVMAGNVSDHDGDGYVASEFGGPYQAECQSRWARVAIHMDLVRGTGSMRIATECGGNYDVSFPAGSCFENRANGQPSGGAYCFRWDQEGLWDVSTQSSVPFRYVDLGSNRGEHRPDASYFLNGIVTGLG